MLEPTLRDELLRMEAEDREVHTELSRTGEIFRYSYHPRLAALHLAQGRRLGQLIDRHGWPGRSIAGADGAHAAWLVLQHAIGLPALQRRALPLLQEAAARGEASRPAPAYLEDRIAFNEGRPQRYGTQFDWDANGEMSPWTLVEPERVNELRASVGLGSLEERTARIRADTLPEHRPKDLARYRAEQAAWARSVGWL
jgi:hypothetical protein